MRVFIKNRKRQKREFQFFMHQFVEECIAEGFSFKADAFYSYKFHFRSLCKRLYYSLYYVIRNFYMKYFPPKKALIVTANGCTLRENVFPYFLNYEIIPMLWDVWPSTWSVLYRDLQAFNVKIVFVTVKSVADKISLDLGIKALWIPEGIDVSVYHKGLKLADRPNDVLEMGRHMNIYHDLLLEFQKRNPQVVFTYSEINRDGTLDLSRLLFKTNEELYSALPTYKILLCFPQCDTNPQRAGDVETLTQRYWEGMLSGCLLLGRAPQELIDIIGYNPLVDVDWDSPLEQLQQVLKNIDSYQKLVDKNYQMALKYAPWKHSISLMKKYLSSQGYQF